jgi:hypothetical protein
MNQEYNFELKPNVMLHNDFPRSIHSINNINCLYLNAQSLRNSLNDLQCFITSLNFKIHIVLVVETWIKATEIQFFNLLNYQSAHSTRPNSIGGGASIFILNEFDTGNIVYEECSNNNNFIIISLIKHNIQIGLCYRQPNNSLDQDGNLFLSKLDILLNSYNKIYFFGDFNINLFDQSSSLVNDYKDIVNSNGLKFLNSTSREYPTRINYRFNTSSCIDHIFTDFHFYKEKLTHAMYLFDNIGDHKNILLSISLPTNKKEDSKTYFKRVNNFKILNNKLLENLNCETFDDLTSQIKNIISNNSICIQNSLRSIKPYVDDKTRTLIEIRNKFMVLKAKYPYSDEIKQRFKYYRNLVNHLIKRSKKVYYEKKFEQSLNDPRKTWQNINTILFNKTSSHGSSCTLLSENGIPVSNPNAIADHLNNFFVNVAVNNTIRNNNTSSSLNDHVLPYQINKNFICPSVTEDEITLIINNLKSSNAVDVYGMSNNFIKIHMKALLNNITEIINKSLFSGNFPDVLKIGIVTPIFKTGDRKNKNNYRPITVNPILGKIFEYVIQRRFQDHLDLNQIIHSRQFGFVKNANTEIAAIDTLHDVYTNIDNQKAVSLTCIDLSKAFDSINHDILIHKLKQLQLDKFFFNLLVSYLDNRKQAVKICDVISSFKTVKAGTPQGGILSNPFFNLYINDIFNLELEGKLTLYCDDITLVNTANNPTELKNIMEHDLRLIHDWLSLNRLVPNTDKTKYMLFHNRKKFEHFTNNALNVQFGGKTLERVENIKLLGLIIDETLSFKDHIQSVKNQIISFSYAIKRVKHFFSDKLSLALYYAHVQSRLMYMNSIWCSAPNYCMNSLEIAQRKSLRILLNKSWFCSKSELYTIRILPVSTLCDVSICIQVFKISKNMLVHNVAIQTADQRHNHRTRARGDYIIPVSRTILGSQTFYIRGLSLFNSLNPTIKSTFSLSLFKSRVKEYFYDKYCEANK